MKIATKHKISLALSLMALLTMAPQESMAGEVIWKTYNDMGTTLINKEKYKEAEEVLVQAVDEARRMGPDRRRMLVSYKLLLSVYAATRDEQKLSETTNKISDLEKELGLAQKPETSGEAAGGETSGESSGQPAEPAEPAEPATPGEPAAPAEPAASADSKDQTATTDGEPASSKALTRETTDSQGQQTSSYGEYESSLNTTPTTEETTAPTTPAVETSSYTSPPSVAYASPTSTGTALKATELKAMEGHINWVKTIQIAPDQSHAASAGFDHTIHYWSIDEGK
ncbi:MAG: hypothetical protein KC777_23630, partial [Cyanobacteria bacterium HKST-UBA02]|nr:hypothetical protein [Cyanobacteria bacterium HKST-UBA02]